ncbi:MAG: T9SS type A sorting domain-containing protein [Bacteroidia bacterium]|nr:T9SS type A sorting domain-containing protein [Bacteroidia bacterium]
MKTLFSTLLIALFVAHSFVSYSQAVGDYRSVGFLFAIQWDNLANWERYNGTNWVVPSLGQGYPGQYAGTGVVSTQAFSNLILDVPPAYPIGRLVIIDGSRFTIGNNTTSRTLTITGDFTNAASWPGGVYVGNYTATHQLNVGGNLINNGDFDLNFDANSRCNITFNGSSNQTISGTGGTNDFNLITVNNTGAANNNIVEVTSTNFTVPAGFLTLTDGIFKVSGAFTLTNTFFNTTNYTIPAGTGLWLNNGSVTVSAQANSITMNGLIRVTAGKYNVGTLTNHDLNYGNNSELTMEGGLLNVQGFFHGAATGNNNIFTMSGGTMTVGITSSSNATYSAFDLRTTGSTFNTSGGTIILQNANTNTGLDYRNAASTYTITGGTVQFGLATTGTGASDDFDVVDGTRFPSISIVKNSSNPTVKLLNTTNVYGNILINNGTSLLANNQTINLAGNSSAIGNWTNNDTFTPGTQSVNFISSHGVQTVGGTSSTTFYDAQINGSGISLAVSTTVSNALTLTLGNATLNTYNLSLTQSATTAVSGGSAASYVITNNSGRFIRNINSAASGTYDFPIGSVGYFNPAKMYWAAAPGVTQISSHFSITVLTNPSSLTAKLYGGSEDTPVTSFLNNGYWDFTATGSTSNYDLTLTSGGATNMGAWAEMHAIFHNTSTASTGWGLDGTPGTPVDVWAGNPTSTGTFGGAISPKTTSVNTFGYFGIGRSDSAYVLPIVLTEFDAVNIGLANLLTWTTATELNNDYFSIERSSDARTFESIGIVSGAGNSSALLHYQFTDEAPLSGINYYRLKQVDFNGDISISMIRSVLNTSTIAINIYPNPATDFITIQFAGQEQTNVSIALLDQTGRQIQLHYIGDIAKNQLVQLPVSDLPAGVYFIKLMQNNAPDIYRFIKQ